MDRLTEEQRKRLDDVVKALQLLPTPELIAEAARIRCPTPLNEAVKKRFRTALGGAFAADKVKHYLHALRKVNTEREELNRRIANLVQLERQRETENDAKGAGEARAMHGTLSGFLDVTLHTFSIYAWRIAVLLPKAAGAAGSKVRPPDQRVLDSYEPLRHHFEHLEKELPGGKNAALFVKEGDDGGVWTIEAGLEVDGQGRFIIDGKFVDVTIRGFEAIEKAVQNTWSAIKAQAVEEVRNHFIKRPNEIPDPSEIHSSLQFRTAIPDDT